MWVWIDQTSFFKFLRLPFRQKKWTACTKWKRNGKKFNFYLNVFLVSRINYSENFFIKAVLSRPETVHGTLRFPVFISPIVWNMCENLPYESVYFKELHNEQECYWPTIYRAGAAVVSTITSIRIEVVWDWIRDSYTETLLNIEGVTEVI